MTQKSRLDAVPSSVPELGCSRCSSCTWQPMVPWALLRPREAAEHFWVCGEEGKWHVLDLELHRRGLGVKMQSAFIVRLCEGLEE